MAKFRNFGCFYSSDRAVGNVQLSKMDGFIKGRAKSLKGLAKPGCFAKSGCFASQNLACKLASL